MGGPGQPVCIVSHLFRTIRTPTPDAQPAFLPLENRREGWTPASHPHPHAAGPGPCPGAHWLWGQRSGWTVPPKTPPHGGSLGPAKEGNGLFWLRPRYLNSRLLSSDPQELQMLSGWKLSSSVSPRLYQRVYPEKECREPLGLPCPGSYLEPTHAHTHATCTPFGT